MKPKPIQPGPGQESVWDYPRPPRLEAFDGNIQIVFNGQTIADTHRAYRILETSHPPNYYLPPADVNQRCLNPHAGQSFCEWKGEASYYDVVVEGRRLTKVAWYYPDPNTTFAPIRNHIAFYAGPMDACLINGEKVIPQSGAFYGGWITTDIVGPFKGQPGTMFW